MGNIKIEIGELLGSVDLFGVEALTTDKVERLERYIQECNDAMNDVNRSPIVEDAVYDRLTEILKEVKPDSELLDTLWSEDVASEEDMQKEVNAIVKREPMRSILTIKDLECKEMYEFINQMPDDEYFDLHYGVKLNGHGIRINYLDSVLVNGASRARSTAGRDLTRQVKLICPNYIDDLEGYGLVEIRGELLLPFENLEIARQYNPEIKSAFTGVSSMSRDSSSDEEISLLRFVAYRFICDGVTFETKAEEYEFLESLGFETPLYFVQENVTKETMMDCIESALADMEEDIESYEYFSDGVVAEVNSRDLFNALGANGTKYNWGNVALKVGYWRQDLYSGYVQCIMWTKGKSKLSPVAIISENPDDIEYEDMFKENSYISDIKEIRNYKDLGILTAGGNSVRRVPLFEPNNILLLEAYVGQPLYFRYGGEAGVVPCYPNGEPLADSKVKQMLTDWDDDEYLYL